MTRVALQLGEGVDLVEHPDELLAQLTAALEAAAARLRLDLAESPPLPAVTVRITAPSQIRALAERASYVCADRVLELTYPKARLIILPPGFPWWTACHAMGHWLAYVVSGVDGDTWHSESLARQAEGPGWLARLFGRRDPWTGPTWV